MKTLLTPTPLIAIELPENSNRIIKGLNECHLAFYDVESFTVYNIGLDFSILGTVDKGVIDFDCDDLVKESIDLPEYKYGGELHPKETWWNYEYDWYNLSSADESFISLLESHSLSLDKKYLIIKPKN